ncbi:hypothetical protein KY320_01255 [Candidatus Woesearchaeota archaeon]|nr:hypothetical protein [Candidatus Woesearchaeota archaeon]
MNWKEYLMPNLLKVLLAFILMFIFIGAESFIENHWLQREYSTTGFPITYQKQKFCLQDTEDCYMYSWSMFVIDLLFWYLVSALIIVVLGKLNLKVFHKYKHWFY